MVLLVVASIVESPLLLLLLQMQLEMVVATRLAIHPIHPREVADLHAPHSVVALHRAQGREERLPQAALVRLAPRRGADVVVAQPPPREPWNVRLQPRCVLLVQRANAPRRLSLRLQVPPREAPEPVGEVGHGGARATQLGDDGRRGGEGQPEQRDVQGLVQRRPGPLEECTFHQRRALAASVALYALGRPLALRSEPPVSAVRARDILGFSENSLLYQELDGLVLGRNHAADIHERRN
mmetsp:Transcript_30844/g.65643  ORF Transcript_30844/g.65643 Transcript_30844/m.65643 type:complete len:239 (-) Transcript_30844:266-982(-)